MVFLTLLWHFGWMLLMFRKFDVIRIFTLLPLWINRHIFSWTENWTRWIISWSQGIFGIVLFGKWNFSGISLVAQALRIWHFRLKRQVLTFFVSFLDIDKSIHLLRFGPFSKLEHFGINNRVDETLIAVDRRTDILISINFEPAILYYSADTLYFGCILLLEHLFYAVSQSHQLKTLVWVGADGWILSWLIFSTFSWLFYRYNCM